MSLLLMILVLAVLTALGWAGASLYEQLDDRGLVPRRRPHHSLK
jgi:hypothetical protein